MKALALGLCIALLLPTLFSCSHTHSFSEEWSSSAEVLWHASVCGHKKKKTDVGGHVYGESGKAHACSVCGYARSEAFFSVSDAIDRAPTDTVVLVEGYYVGVADSGTSAGKELMLKDKATDRLIGVQGVPYGEFPNFGYEKGDLIRLYGIVVHERYTERNNASQNKIYMTFASENSLDIADTVLSRGNKVSYSFSDALEIDSHADMQAFFNCKTASVGTYVHIKGDVWFNTYAKGTDGVVRHRLSMNSAATSLCGIKPDATRAVVLRPSTAN